MRETVIIVAGGKGLRMGESLAKQFIPLNGKPILMHTLEAFHRWDKTVEILLVLPKEQEAYWTMICRELSCQIPHRIVYGGETRFHSVQNGLNEVKKSGLIAVHDGVRPFVTERVISSCFFTARSVKSAVPAVSVIDSVREIKENTSRLFDRNKLCIVQTPQVFHAGLLREAYTQPYNAKFTDDASLVEAAGYDIHLVEGNRENIKITTPMDLKLAELFIEGNIING